MSAIPVSVRAVSDHGGNLSAARARHPGAPEPWIDLSTGINPWPYPLPPLAPELWQRLPDDATLESLAEAAALYYGAPDARHVCAASGSQALIQALPRLRPPGRVAVLGPTYAEHALAWANAGHSVAEVPELPETDAWDVVIVVNPNNPTGAAVARADLLAAAARAAARGGWLVVDEAFADTCPEISVAAHAGAPGLIVLRSFGKFFGLAGLRLGFALAAPPWIERLRAVVGPWAVSGPAVAIARAAFHDTAWVSATRAALGAATEDLDRLLSDSGLSVVGGTPLFRLCELAEGDAAYRRFERLSAAGILVRRFEARPRWLRFGLPADAAARLRLAEALA